MFSNSQAIFSQLAKTLYRAGLYISAADGTGYNPRGKAGTEDIGPELEALKYVIAQLERQSAPDGFLGSISKLANDDVKNIPGPLPGTTGFMDGALKEDLKKVPDEVKEAAKLALANFTADEARLYTDVLIAVCGSVAQIYDEFEDLKGPFGNTAFFKFMAAFDRTLTTIGRQRKEGGDKYLYDPESLFQQIKISEKEDFAMAEIIGKFREAWTESGKMETTIS